MRDPEAGTPRWEPRHLLFPLSCLCLRLPYFPGLSIWAVEGGRAAQWCGLMLCSIGTVHGGPGAGETGSMGRQRRNVLVTQEMPPNGEQNGHEQVHVHRAQWDPLMQMQVSLLPTLERCEELFDSGIPKEVAVSAPVTQTQVSGSALLTTSFFGGCTVTSGEA